MTTTASAPIEKTPGVCGGDARIRNTRIPVWLLVLARKQGLSDGELLDAYPALAAADLDAGWEYYREHPVEIEQAIWFNDTAANVPDGQAPPTWVVVAGRLLGLTDTQIQSAFEPTLTANDLAAAWDAFRADPVGVVREMGRQRLAG
jgi:uncharacterized protein (DUF433 family)